MEIVDDTQLVILARRPATAMFPILDRSRAFLPLLALLCVLPAICVFPHRHVGESDALWGLRALESSQKRWPQQVVAPTATGAEGILRWQPPLGVWLTAGLVRVTHSASPIVLSAVSFLSSALTVALFAALVRLLSSSRAAIWATLFAAFQSSLLRLSWSSAPPALGLCLGTAALWGYFSHLESGRRGWSLRLLAGGFALGLCLLAGGPLALVVVAVLFLYALGLRGESLSRRQWLEPRTISVWAGWPALRALGLFVVAGFVVGGWWPLLRWSQDGENFLGGWMYGVMPARAASYPGLRMEAAASTGRSLAMELLILSGPMFGLVALGVGRNVVGIVASMDEPSRRTRLFLVLWAIISVAMVADAMAHEESWTSRLLQWEALLGLSFSAIAGLCVDEITRREISLRPVATAAIAAAVVTISAGALGENDDLWRQGVWEGVALGVILLGVLAWKLFYSGADRDLRHRVALGILVLAPLQSGASSGLESARRDTEDDLALESFRRGILSARPVTDLISIGTAEEIPLRLQLAVRSAEPAIPLETVESWESVLARSVASPENAPRSILALDWTGRINRPVNLQAAGIQIVPVTSTRFFSGGPLRGYLVRRESYAPQRQRESQKRTDAAQASLWGE